MPLSIRHKLNRLPKRFPVGTTFVIEGRAIGAEGKNNGRFRVFSRFVVLPGGRRIDLAGEASGTRNRRSRNRSRQGAPARAAAGSKKIVSGRGTTLQHRR